MNVLIMNRYLLQIALDQGTSQAQVLLNGSQGISRTISASWDNTWNVALSGGVYKALCSFGIFIAMACLSLWVLDFGKKWLQDEVNGIWAFQDIVFPLIVALLLSNTGANLAALSKTGRTVINYFNDQVLTYAVSDVLNSNMEKALSEIADYSTTKAQIEAQRNQCNSIADTKSDRMVQCLQDVTNKTSALLAQYRALYGPSKLAQSLAAQAAAVAADPGSALQDLGAKAVDTAQSAAISVVNVASQPLLIAVELFMMACQTAFQHLIEVSMLLTAVMGPLAVGGSLLPFGQKPVVAWITGFFSLGICKMSYNVITGLTAISIQQIGPTETLASAIFFGLLSPILALAISAGGGMAVFNGILAAGAAAAGLGFSMGSSAASAAGSMAKEATKNVGAGE